MFNPNQYIQPYQYNSYQQQNIVKVNGENGARTYQISANSSALLLDENEPLVWLVQSDGAGYKTVTPYKIEPYVKEPEPTVNDLIKRIEKLEGVLYESNTSENARESE